MRKIDGRSREARAIKAKQEADRQLAAHQAVHGTAMPVDSGGGLVVRKGVITSQTGKRYAPIGADKEQIGGDHYMNMGVQPWAAMESWMSREQFAGFLRGNAIKYLARCEHKGGVEDLRKARRYLDKLIETSEAI